MKIFRIIIFVMLALSLIGCKPEIANSPTFLLRLKSKLSQQRKHEHDGPYVGE